MLIGIENQKTARLNTCTLWNKANECIHHILENDMVSLQVHVAAEL